jgi:hypothetical protein
VAERSREVLASWDYAATWSGILRAAQGLRRRPSP